ncbi:DUF2987 domain-containing protein [Nitrospirillum sp. BR 11828]|uniref:DUF2987 domain-containing protein n=1 Tax=Nitrospirillum sp. BR 11828 TaxID=3104325 RepID=UPI002ACAEAE3|nr:hypothetical protein [Nitrospirillum sp. BR 11828]MDZ5646266.1 hypothetical protein [Nitrospirillum sp. BR 11828]
MKTRMWMGAALAALVTVCAGGAGAQTTEQAPADPAAAAQVPPQTTPSPTAPQDEAVPEMVVTSREQFGKTSYAKLAEALKVLDHMENASGHHLRMIFKVQLGKDKSGPLPIQLWAVYNGKEEPIESTPDGYFHIPYRADWEAADAKLVSNQAKGSLRATVMLEVLSDGKQPIAYGELRQGAKVLDQAIEEFVGPVMGFFVPSIDELDFSCEPDAHCHVHAALDTGEALETDDKGQPILEFGRKLDRRNPTLHLSATVEDGSPTRLYALPQFHVF